MYFRDKRYNCSPRIVTKWVLTMHKWERETMGKGQNALARVGIAGLGRSGWRIHSRGLERLPEKFRIVAVADADAARRAEAAAKFGCRTYADFDSLVEDADVELLCVATPSHLHPEHAIQALRAGKDVVCEKPMAPSAAAADRMIAAAREAGRVLAVFQNKRYAPDFVKVRQVIASGKLGRIVMIRFALHLFGRRWDWQTLKKFGGGSLNNNASHHLDQLLLLFGDAEPEVFCHLERVLTSGDAEDHVKVILRAPDSPMIDLEMTNACPYPQESWLVMGTRGGLTGNAEGLRWKYTDFDKLLPRSVDPNPTPDRSYNAEELPWEEETWQAPQHAMPSESVCEATRFYADLYETLRHGAPLVITPESVRRQVAILEKCHQLCPL